jgi:hypothetical protein
MDFERTTNAEFVYQELTGAKSLGRVFLQTAHKQTNIRKNAIRKSNKQSEYTTQP